jgi:TRAP-type C4-dicarboxylate transport system substrate-binding protein
MRNSRSSAFISLGMVLVLVVAVAPAPMSAQPARSASMGEMSKEVLDPRYPSEAAACSAIPKANATGPSVTWSWAHDVVVGPDSPWDQVWARQWKRSVEEATSKRLRINLLMGQMKATETIYSVGRNEVQGGLTFSPYYGDLVISNWMTLPFFLRNGRELLHGLKAAEKWMNEELQGRANVQSLYVGGYTRQVFWGKKPITRLQDFKGLKIRSWGAAGVRMIQAFEATPVSIPWAETYPAAQRGVVDVATAGLGGGFTSKMHEVLPVVSDWYFGEGTLLFVVNRDALNQLPADMKAAVFGVRDCLAAGFYRKVLDNEEWTVERLPKEGGSLHTPEPGEVEKAAAVARPVWDWWLGIAGAKGQEVFKAVEAAVKPLRQ